MKKLLAIIFPFLLVNTSFGQGAYPLPSTEVYGSLLVQSSFLDTLNGWNFGNDTIDLGGFGQAPSAGVWEYYGSGLWYNILTDFSSVGSEEREMRIGFGSSIQSSDIIIDTTRINFDSPRVEIRTSDEIQIGMDVSPIVRIRPDSLLDIDGTRLYISSDTFGIFSPNKYVNIGSDGRVNIQGQDPTFVSSRSEIYLTANQQDSDNWEYGFTAFTNDNATCCNGTATMYALREDYKLDVSQIYVDTNLIKLSHRFNVTGPSAYNVSDYQTNALGHSWIYGQGGGTPSVPSDQQAIMSLNASGFDVTAYDISLTPAIKTNIEKQLEVDVPDDSVKFFVGQMPFTLSGFPTVNSGSMILRQTNDADKLSIVGAFRTGFGDYNSAISVLDTSNGQISDVSAFSDLSQLRWGNLLSTEYNRILASEYGIYMQLGYVDTARFLIEDQNGDRPFLVNPEDSTVTIAEPYKFINGGASYGEMGFGDSLTTISLTQNTETWVTNGTNDLWSAAALQLTSDVVYDGDSLTISTSGDYMVQVQVSMSGNNGSEITLGVLKNGAEDCFCVSNMSLANNTTFSLTYTDITDVTAGDVFKVFIENINNNDDVDVINGKIVMHRLN